MFKCANLSFRLGLVLMLILGLYPSLLLGQEGPIARAVPNGGTLEYRRGDGAWGTVTRPKYLFEDYSLRTGPDASATIVLLESNESMLLQADSELLISGSALQLQRGDLSLEPDTDSPLLAGLSSKFQNAQQFTTVRRQANCDESIRPASEISLSASYPEIVWKNACSDYSYRLTVGMQVFIIPPAEDGEMVRFKLNEIPVGEHDYKVEVLQGNRVVYTPRRGGKLHWLDADSEAEIQRKLALAATDAIFAGSILEQHGYLVPALDIYREFFNANVEDNDLRPILIMTYANLGLTTLQADEVRLYNMLSN